MTLFDLPDWPNDPWLLALCTVAALAVAGLVWVRWTPGQWRRPFEPSSGWPGSHSQNRSASIGEVQDRLGLQLLTARTMAQTGGSMPAGTRLQQLDHQLAQALLSLRLMRDAMRSEPASLADGLTGLQAHFQPVLAERGIRLHWELTPQAEQVRLSARERLHLLRVVQEALDNAVAHAGNATLVSVSCRLVAPRGQRPNLTLVVQDDGHSAGATVHAQRPDFVCTGTGLARLEHQATEIGARLAMGPGPDGWVVEVALPLE
ncbi:sensor histidine kinase [Sphaerotilus sp.]|uniref:sensor histidine kinase n=1 Tax=Sphaerotilus sp. TaxID=2093942 RepID=UPI0034E290D2